jgi:hypothetical protein
MNSGILGACQNLESRLSVVVASTPLALSRHAPANQRIQVIRSSQARDVQITLNEFDLRVRATENVIDQIMKWN